MRLLVVTHYFPPEVGATQTRLFEVTRSLARRGHEVAVVAPFPHYPTGRIPPEYRSRFVTRDTADGVRIVRTWVYAVPNRDVVKRVVDYASFGVTSLAGAIPAGAVDVVFAETPPLFPGLSAYAISRLKGCPYVCNVADRWVASAAALGALRNRSAIRTGAALERFVYEKAARVTTVTHGIREALAAAGVPEDRLELIPNGVDTTFFRPDVDGSEWRSRFGGPSGFVALYAGNHGLAQGLETVVDAAARLRSRTEIRFVFVGDGAVKEQLRQLVVRSELTNVAFFAPQPREQMPAVLAAADICLVPLKAAEPFDAAVPSKLFEAMAAARPVLLSAAGEAAALVERADAGVCVPPESPPELAAGVTRLADDPALRHRLGQSGRRFAEKGFDRERLVDRYEAVLGDAVAAGPSSS